MQPFPDCWGLGCVGVPVAPSGSSLEGHPAAGQERTGGPRAWPPGAGGEGRWVPRWPLHPGPPPVPRLVLKPFHPTSCDHWLSLSHCPGGQGGWGPGTVGRLCPAHALPLPVNGTLVNSCPEHGGNPVAAWLWAGWAGQGRGLRPHRARPEADGIWGDAGPRHPYRHPPSRFQDWNPIPYLVQQAVTRLLGWSSCHPQHEPSPPESPVCSTVTREPFFFPLGNEKYIRWRGAPTWKITLLQSHHVAASSFPSWSRLDPPLLPTFLDPFSRESHCSPSSEIRPRCSQDHGCPLPGF